MRGGCYVALGLRGRFPQLLHSRSSQPGFSRVIIICAVEQLRLARSFEQNIWTVPVGVIFRVVDQVYRLTVSQGTVPSVTTAMQHLVMLL